MNENMGTNIMMCILGLCAAILISVLVMAIITGATPVQCNAIASVNPNLQFHWSLWTGCLVKIPGADYFVGIDRVEVVNNRIVFAPPQ